MITEWIACCTTCNRILDRSPNGEMMSAAGKIHKESHPRHFVIVGWEVI